MWEEKYISRGKQRLLGIFAALIVERRPLRAREIALLLHVSESVVYKNLQNLLAAGFIEKMGHSYAVNAKMTLLFSAYLKGLGL